MRAILAAALLAGCWPVAACPQADTSTLLAKCRGEARAAFDAGATADAAELIYERCKQREGVAP